MRKRGTFKEKSKKIMLTGEQAIRFLAVSIFLGGIFLFFNWIGSRATKAFVLNSLGYHYNEFNVYLFFIILLSFIQPTLLLICFFWRKKTIQNLYLILLTISLIVYPIVISYGIDVYFKWAHLRGIVPEYDDIEPVNSIDAAGISVFSSVLSIILAIVISIILEIIPEDKLLLSLRGSTEIRSILKWTIIVTATILALTILILLAYTYIAGWSITSKLGSMNMILDFIAKS